MERGVNFAYEERFGGVILYHLPTGQSVFLQPGDEASEFLRQVERITEIWVADPENRGRRCFSSWEEHLDALIEPYF